MITAGLLAALNSQLVGERAFEIAPSSMAAGLLYHLHLDCLTLKSLKCWIMENGQDSGSILYVTWWVLGRAQQFALGVFRERSHCFPFQKDKGREKAKQRQRIRLGKEL